MPAPLYWLPLSLSLLLIGCATGNTPEDKKRNARQETGDALNELYAQHPSARQATADSVAYLVCTGSDAYLFMLATGGGVCVLHEKPGQSYWRFATGGAGLGLGFKKVAFVQAFMTREALTRFKTEGFDGQARAEASIKHEEDDAQVSGNQSVDFEGVKVYQINMMGAAVQATLSGYKYWQTDFSDDVMQNPE